MLIPFALDQDPDAPIPARAMTITHAVFLIEGVDEADSDDPETETIEAWQLLIDTGTVWTLQGVYGRTARDLIEAGVCVRPTTEAV